MEGAPDLWDAGDFLSAALVGWIHTLLRRRAATTSCWAAAVHEDDETASHSNPMPAGATGACT